MTSNNERILAAMEADSAVVLTEGTVISVNAERYQALFDAGLLAEVAKTPMGWPLFGIESEAGDGMVFCMIAAVLP